MTYPAHKRPWFLPNGHLETIWPSLCRKAPTPRYRRERITTADDDFLDLDWLQAGRKRLVIISHGLEGDSHRHYVTGMARTFAAESWDVLAWNFRGCSGEINRQPRFTHNGATDDLHAVVSHALQQHDYTSVTLVGFSMGGNLSLVYLGREAAQVPEQVRGAVCFSVPCDLAAASECLAQAGNRIYMQRFMSLMGRKVKHQAQHYPELFPCDDYAVLKTFHDFDNRYTAPLHGFSDARHYWRECSSLPYLDAVRVPAWIVSAQNDPFLPPQCYPKLDSHANPLVQMLTPPHGGHCGFAVAGGGSRYWSEALALSLLSEVDAV
ncbi:MAG: alpha/beta fold hydrolase [Desulfuromonadales bacterium]|nr:alpha/beta fold hydrolase [Desulfuromonadales bacterium]